MNEVCACPHAVALKYLSCSIWCTHHYNYITTGLKYSDEPNEQQLQGQRSLQPVHYDNEQAEAPDLHLCEYYS